MSTVSYRLISFPAVPRIMFHIISYRTCTLLHNKLPRMMSHIPYRFTLLMKSPESCHDSRKLIRSVIRYGIWNMIRGSLLDDMRHNLEEVFITLSLFCPIL
eukprot:sb/3478516/